VDHKNSFDRSKHLTIALYDNPTVSKHAGERSGQVYGASARSGRPLDEDILLAPTNEYAVTKAAADLAVGALAEQGLRCVRIRPFNHTGPGQSENFLVPSLAMQIARIEAGLQAPVISIGNFEAERDFLDVRDVTAAYAIAVAKSDAVPSGTILNIASGTPRRIRDVLDVLLALSHVAITVKQEPKRMRPSETLRLVGDATRARLLLGWSPEHNEDQSAIGRALKDGVSNIFSPKQMHLPGYCCVGDYRWNRSQPGEMNNMTRAKSRDHSIDGVRISDI
jgi:nucleoside-diphosphate-sugar epimerase